MSDAFPRAYERVILSHSSHYVPNDMSKKHLERFLSSTDFPVLRRPPSKLSDSQSISAGQDETHSNSNMHVVCRTLHPREPSCFKNYVNALLYESRKVWKWVGAFGALSIALRYRGEVLRRPGKLARQWLVSTARGTAFVVGNITTSWYLTCLMQQILPPGMFVNSRWLVNGALSSLWILVLPPKRRDEIALYVGRLAALSMWRAYRLKGGPHLPYGEVVIFGTAWAHLSESMRTGEKVGGLMGLGIAEVERKR
ncbi:hypothetical protein BD410DRAFT_568796 [Rickenella mellea]|uniref:Transmembrane protein 135 N-terminal domain-containing protein n=1 Tax=Rickenella mellea TaxID=50990 RepID=A0A4Y7QFX9_9AGAM|nr:hypothetical protein BD410DRAFT_568796 [Rickenella mellea]